MMLIEHILQTSIKFQLSGTYDDIEEMGLEAITNSNWELTLLGYVKYWWGGQNYLKLFV